MPRKKRLRQQEGTAPSKTLARARENASYLSDFFSWSARYLDTHCQGSWDWDLTPQELHTVLQFLEEMGRLTWGEIRSQTTGNHKKHHDYEINLLTQQAYAHLMNLRDEHKLEFGKVFRFRLSAKSRLWGFCIGSIFHIVWYDRDHQVYPVEKD